MARRPRGFITPPPLPFRVEKTRRGWSGAVIVRLWAYPFLNFLGFKIRPCEEGPAR